MFRKVSLCYKNKRLNWVEHLFCRCYLGRLGLPLITTAWGGWGKGTMRRKNSVLSVWICRFWSILMALIVLVLRWIFKSQNDFLLHVKKIKDILRSDSVVVCLKDVFSRRMLALQVLVLVLAPLASSQPAPTSCCETKTVGGVSYT